MNKALGVLFRNEWKYKMEKALGIRFPDNDFHATFRPIVEHIVNSNLDTTDKKVIRQLINYLVYGYYYMYQNSNYAIWDKHYTDILPYLLVEEEWIYIGEEVDNYFKDPKSDFNHDFHYCYPGQPVGSI